MGLLAYLRGEDLSTTTTTDAPLLSRGAIEQAIAFAVAERQANFTTADALRLPAVARAVDLIVSVGSSFHPVEFLSGTANPDQPRFLRRPDPFSSRTDWLAMTIQEMVYEGEWFWLLGDLIEGYPTHALVLPHDEVYVEWDDRRFQRRYRWRDRELVHGRDIYHGAINRRPQDLHGKSVLKTALPYLATLAAAEEFAADAFDSGSVPHTVLKAAMKLTDEEAKRLKAQYLGDGGYQPVRVAGAGVDLVFPDVDPQRMQLAEARSAGATTVARLMGIPGPLLLAETHGASVTYQNVDAVVAQLTKVTILPRYLGPIEAALSDLVPRTKSVRFSMEELNRADVMTRFSVYEKAIAAGVMEPEEARAFEGYPPAPPPLNRFTQYDPVPTLGIDPTAVSESEVPVA